MSIATVLILSAGIAQAAVPRLISYGSFSSSPAPVGVGVDQSSGDVYVGDSIELSTFGAGNVNKFDAQGKVLSPPSPFGSGLRAGVAVNPTNSDVYAMNIFGAIETFDPNSGARLSAFAAPISGELTARLLQIASDSVGDVYLPVPAENKVLEYSSTGTLLNTFTGAGALSKPTGVAVDSSGDVWVADNGNNRIEELSPTDTFIGEIKSEGVGAVALDTHGDVFAMVNNSADFCGSIAPPCFHLVEYSSAGAQLADIGAGSVGLVGNNPRRLPSQVAVNGSTGRVYVSDPTKERVLVFGPPTAPIVERELTAEVGSSEAKLGARVNPSGIETTDRFEYLTEAAFQANGASFSGPNHPTSVPFPEGNVGQGILSRTVWASASGLEPGTTYRYRVVATNALGEAVGADQTFTTQTIAQASCANEQFRIGFSANLPDCRAYELVTPPNKLSAQPDTAGSDAFANNGGGATGNVAASDGNRMSYISTEVLPGSSSGGWEYVANRGAGGWSSESVLPLQSYTADRCSQLMKGSSMLAYSDDLSMGVLFVGGAETYNSQGSLTAGCGAEGVEVVSGEPLGVENLLLRNNTNATYQLINLPPPGVTPNSAKFAGASSNLSHVVFTENAQLTANAPTGVPDLFEWTTGGAVRLVTILPDNTPTVGALAADRQVSSHVVSTDGSHIFFIANGALYVRMNGSTTVQIDAANTSGSGGGGTFDEASANGTRVFFTDENKLTADSTAESGEPDLYECELPEGANACKLTDLTVAKAGEHANISGSPVISEDGSYVYFVAAGVLSGSQQNPEKEMAQVGRPNLYVYHAGTTTFIKTVNKGDAVTNRVARVSPNGEFLAFQSTKSLTGYDNKEAGSGSSDPEIFLYSAASNRLVCASCNPSGEPPVMGPGIPGFGEGLGGATIGSAGVRFLSDSGQVFFETREALLPLDTNGQMDVYEYENGQLHLISPGTSSSRSIFLDASQDGSNVFFLTSQKLVAQDTNAEALNIYDARVNGGFPEVASPPPCTTADACRAPVSPQPSLYGAPSSQTFAGVGNLAPQVAVKPQVKRKSKPVKCRKGFVKKKRKCVKRPKKNVRNSAHANKRTGK